ncbi:indole-3-glycerol phosphate synthase [Ruminococcus sp. YRD2003]|uniref:indole-3-glycerol phosphate synthase TrpC n=1 Tax=Ruminococcus sp. YRD2003 TaxID=1452313 RepID=UPI0008D418F6|nr:indole-3-glycerol phosphate synthase [Ruminococcus flavefaciens]
MNILEELSAATRERVETSKRLISADEMKYMALSMQDDTFDFEIALSKKGLSFIAECKRAMPTIGTIAEGHHIVDTANELENAGADCISVVTEPIGFNGCRDHLRLIVNEVSIPCLRKEAVVDEYMIYESKIIGAKAVLLIPSLISDDDFRSYIAICDSLGLSAFVECCSEEDIKRALSAGSRIITVDNRNLTDFSIDHERCIRLRDTVPSDVIYVAEGGISTPEQIARLREVNVDAVIVGTALMQAEDRTAKLHELKGRR